MKHLCLNKAFHRKSFILNRFLFRIMLDLSYMAIISVYWSYYMNLTLRFSIIRLFISYIVSAFLIIGTPDLNNTISSFFLNIQLYVFLLPMCSLYGLSGRSLSFLTLISLCHIMQSGLLCWKPNIASFRKVVIPRNQYLLLLGLIFILIPVVSFFILTEGVPTFTAFNLYKVYEIRKNSIKLIKGMNYLVPWVTKVIIPFLLVFYLDKKKWGRVFFIVLIQMYLYTILAQKTFLFTPVLVIGVYYLIKKDMLNWGFEKGFSVGICVTSGLFLLNHNWIMPVSLFVRRIFFVPATIKFSFYDFFIKNPKVHFADGMIGRIFGITSPYEMEIPKKIASFIGRPDSNCNGGYLADAYANGGVVAVIIIAVLLVVFIKLLESFSKNVNLAVASASCAYLFYSLNDTAFLTSMLTGGGILLLLIFLVNSMNSWHKNDV